MYKVILMGFDGEYVTDSEHETKEDANETAADLGSKWYFYPWYFCVENQTIVDAAGIFCNTKTGEPTLKKIFCGKRLKTAQKVFKALSERRDMEDSNPETFESVLIDEMLF